MPLKVGASGAEPQVLMEVLGGKDWFACISVRWVFWLPVAKVQRLSSRAEFGLCMSIQDGTQPPGHPCSLTLLPYCGPCVISGASEGLQG